jgi:sugar phosphate isomerase/epimerase
MRIALGVDTLSYHCRLDAGEITVQEVLDEVADLGFEFLQLNAVHLRDVDDNGLAALRQAAEDRGMPLTLAGDVIGRPENDTPEVGAERIRRWIAMARKLGSPYARASSGFYRNEVMGRPEAIEAHKKYLIAALNAYVDSEPLDDTLVLLENHSDFTPEEYGDIIAAVDARRVGVFLDVINPVTMLLDPLPVVQKLAPFAPAGHVKDFRLVSQYVEGKFHRRGFDVQYCYPGEGVAALPALMHALQASPADPYMLSIEGLDNRRGVADQRERLAAAAATLRPLIERGAA